MNVAKRIDGALEGEPNDVGRSNDKLHEFELGEKSMRRRRPVSGSRTPSKNPTLSLSQWHGQS
jgi:hypothetical protein